MLRKRLLAALLLALSWSAPAWALDFPWLSWAVRSTDQVSLKQAALSLPAITINQGNYKRAVEQLAALAAKEPRNPDVHLLLSRAWYRLGEGDKALKALDTALAAAPSAELLLEKASLYRELNLIAAGEAYFRQVLATHPALAADIHKILGTFALLEHFDGQAGHNEFKQALEAAPNDVVNMFGVANSFYAMQRYDESLAYMHKAIAAIEQLPRPPKRLLADAYLTVAGAVGEKALSGSLIDLLKYGPQVKKSIDRGCRIDPADPWCAYAQARFYLEAPALVGGNPPKAIPLFQKIRRQEPRTWPFHLYLIRAYAINKQLDLARAELQKFLAAHHDDPIAMGYLNKGRVALGL